MKSNDICDDCMQSFGEFLSNNQSIYEVDISGKEYAVNKLTDKGIEILSNSLENISSLRVLDVSCNSLITNNGVPYILDILEKTHIQRLFYQGTTITPENKLITITFYSIGLRKAPTDIDLRR